MSSLLGWPQPDEYDPCEGINEPARVHAVLRARDQGVVSLRALELPFMPRPLPSEAISSWLSRAALSQGVSLGELQAFLGWGTARDDLDLWFGAWFKECSFDGEPIFHRLEHARQLMSQLVDGPWSSQRMLLDGGATGRYRYCPICFDTDSLPFFRQEWRFDAWRACAVHGCLMEDRCPDCGTPPTLPFSMLYAARHRGVALLDECRTCGGSLRGAKPVRLHDAVHAGIDPWALALMANGRALIAALRLGRFEVAGLSLRPGDPAVCEFVCRALLPTALHPPAVAEVRRRLASLVAQPTLSPPKATIATKHVDGEPYVHMC